MFVSKLHLLRKSCSVISDMWKPAPGCFLHFVFFIFLIYSPFFKAGRDEVMTVKKRVYFCLFFFLLYQSLLLNILSAFSSSDLFWFLENRWNNEENKEEWNSRNKGMKQCVVAGFFCFVLLPICENESSSMLVGILRYTLHPNLSCILNWEWLLLCHSYCCATAMETQLYATVADLPPSLSSKVAKAHS